MESSHSVDLYGVLFQQPDGDIEKAELVPLVNASDTGTGLNFLFQIELEPGTYYLMVGFEGLSDLGSYELDVRFKGGDPFPDDHSDTLEEATPILLDSTTPGTNESPTDLDLFRAEITQPGLLRARTQLPELIGLPGFFEFSDTTGLLFDEKGNPLAFNNERELVSLPGLDAEQPGANDGTFEFTAMVSPGTYFIGVGSFGIGVGNYLLEVELGAQAPTDDHGDDIASATLVPEVRDELGAADLLGRCLPFGLDFGIAVPPDPDCPDSVFLEHSGRLDLPGDRDLFRIELATRGVLTVSTVSLNDTLGILMNGRGEAIARSDDGGGFLVGDFVIEHALEAGQYLIEVRGSDGIGTGPYYLDVAFRSSPGGPTNDIPLELEEPQIEGGMIHSGVANIRGWVISPIPIERVELFIDGLFTGLIPYGGSRGDVGNNTYREFPNASHSGFSMAFLYGLLAEDEPHTIGVKVFDENGHFAEASAQIGITSFDELVFTGLVDLAEARVQVAGARSLMVRDMMLGTGRYDAELEFRVPTQSLSITSITRTGTAARTRVATEAPSSEPRSINEGIIITLEEPIAGSSYQGIANIRGWAVGPTGIERIDYFIDNILLGTIPYGGSRQDVGAAFPSFPNTSQSGFSMAFNYGTLSPGAHNVRVVAIGPNNAENAAQATFTVAGFPDEPFIKNPQRLDMRGASAVTRNESFVLQEVHLDDRSYDLTVAFRRATQNFAITHVAPRVGPTAPPVGHIVAPKTTQTLTAGDVLAFEGAGTGGMGPYRYRWAFGDPAIPDATEQNPGQVRFATPGTFTVALTVTDAQGRSDPDPPTVTVRVNERPRLDNEPPVVSIIYPNSFQHIPVRKRARFTAQASDPDGDAISYRWVFDNGRIPSSTERSPLVTLPDELADRKIKVEVEVSDGELSDSDSVILFVFRPKPDDGGR